MYIKVNDKIIYETTENEDNRFNISDVMTSHIYNLLTIDKAQEVARLYGLQPKKYFIFIYGKMYILDKLKPVQIDMLYSDLQEARKTCKYVYEIEGYEFTGV